MATTSIPISFSHCNGCYLCLLCLNADDHIWKTTSNISSKSRLLCIRKFKNFKYNYGMDQQKLRKQDYTLKLSWNMEKAMFRNGRCVILHFALEKLFGAKAGTIDDSLLINDAFPRACKGCRKNIWSWTRWRKTMDYNYNS